MRARCVVLACVKQCFGARSCWQSIFHSPDLGHQPRLPMLQPLCLGSFGHLRALRASGFVKPTSKMVSAAHKPLFQGKSVYLQGFSPMLLFGTPHPLRPAPPGVCIPERILHFPQGSGFRVVSTLFLPLSNSSVWRKSNSSWKLTVFLLPPKP